MVLRIDYLAGMLIDCDDYLEGTLGIAVYSVVRSVNICHCAAVAVVGVAVGIVVDTVVGTAADRMRNHLVEYYHAFACMLSVVLAALVLAC